MNVFLFVVATSGGYINAINRHCSLRSVGADLIREQPREKVSLLQILSTSYGEDVSRPLTLNNLDF